jgi:hypothetical protein
MNWPEEFFSGHFSGIALPALAMFTVGGLSTGGLKPSNAKRTK